MAELYQSTKSIPAGIAQERVVSGYTLDDQSGNAKIGEYLAADGDKMMPVDEFISAHPCTNTNSKGHHCAGDVGSWQP